MLAVGEVASVASLAAEARHEVLAEVGLELDVKAGELRRLRRKRRLNESHK